LFLNIIPISSYLTFVKGGYIIRISPIAIGIDVVPICNFPMKLETEGKKYPIKTPKTIVKNIHKVRYLSMRDNLFATDIFIDSPPPAIFMLSFV